MDATKKTRRFFWLSRRFSENITKNDHFITSLDWILFSGKVFKLWVLCDRSGGVWAAKRCDWEFEVAIEVNLEISGILESAPGIGSGSS